ncbi:hypothetical protein ACFLZ0_00600 [Patescibacteria group bacterium]
MKKINFYNYPKPLQRKDYEEVCSLAIDELKKDVNVISAYLENDNWVPGISDIDIMVIYKNCAKRQVFTKSFLEFSEKAKYIFVHRYINYNQNTFQDWVYLNPHYDKAKFLLGKPLTWRLPKNELDQNECHWLQAIFVFDLLINKLLLFFRYKFEEKIDVHNLIVVISSFKYTLDIFYEITGLKLDDNFSLAIDDMRNRWFFRGREENIKILFNLLNRTEDLILELIDRLDNFLVLKIPDFINKIKGDKVIFRNSKYDLVFIDNWEKNIFLDEFRRGLIKFKLPLFGRREDLDSYRLILPNSLFFFLAVYLKEQGPFSKLLRNRMDKDYSVLLDKVDFNRGLKEHAKVANNYIIESINFKGEKLKLWFSYGFYPYLPSFKRRLINFVMLFFKKIYKPLNI